MLFRSFFCCTLLTVASVTSAAEPNRAEQNWPRFRGPLGTGESVGKTQPVSLNSGSVAWSAALPVRGHSSPIVWEDRIFLTGASGENGQVRRHVICLNRSNGDVLWNKVASVGGGEQLHKMNSWATPSCATDGESVVAFFGSGGLHCFDFQGEPMWSRDLGTFPGGWGVGASPIFFGDTVIQNCDAEGDSYLLAVDKRTGKDVWRTPRQSKPRGGWSTPVVIETDGRTELVVNGEFGVESYEPQSGKPLWNCRGFNGRGTPMPAWGNGLLYVVNGKSGDVYAVRPGGSGDVTDSRMQWHTARRGGRDLPSPVLANDVMVVIGMSGVATGYDAKQGDELWKERLGGNFSGSPVVIGKVVYALSDEGDLIAVKPGPKLESLGRLSLRVDDDEVFRTSIAISGSQMLVRSDRRIYCIGK